MGLFQSQAQAACFCHGEMHHMSGSFQKTCFRQKGVGGKTYHGITNQITIMPTLD